MEFYLGGPVIFACFAASNSFFACMREERAKKSEDVSKPAGGERIKGFRVTFYVRSNEQAAAEGILLRAG